MKSEIRLSEAKKVFGPTPEWNKTEGTVPITQKLHSLKFIYE